MKKPNELIEQLIAEYEQKISDTEKLISDATERKRVGRSAGATYEARHILYQEIAKLAAKRDACIQARVDIESILDSIELFGEAQEQEG